MDKAQLQYVQAFLKSPKKLVIIPHKNPDGDAMGASLGLCAYLRKKGHEVAVVAPNESPQFLHWLPGFDEVLQFDRDSVQSQKTIAQSDLIFLLDFNALHRVGDALQKILETYPNDFLMIDHHQQPESVATYFYSDTTMSSTCQMVYQFIEMLDDLDTVDSTVATCLYTGIMTDTGSFRFPATTSTTHRIVAELMDKGAQNDLIYDRVYNENSYHRLQLLGLSLQNLKVLPEYRTAFITLSEEEKKRYRYRKGDTEGTVNYALSLKNVIFAAIFIEDKEQKLIKISFRSKGLFSVNTFARKHFQGGGHSNASGGKTELSLEDTVSYFKTLLPIYQKELQEPC